MTRTLLVFLSLQFFPYFAVSNSVNNSLNNILFSGNYQFYDLTYPFDNKTVYWPDAKEFEFTKKTHKYLNDGTWYSANEFAADEHGGTHIDAPSHFTMSGALVGTIPVQKLIVALTVIDISSEVADDPEFILFKHHLGDHLFINFSTPSALIFRFGWSKFLIKEKDKYFGYNATTKTVSFPGLSREVAEWITLRHRNVVGVGVDVPSVDPGSSTNYMAHKTFATAGVYNMENVFLTHKLPETGCTALVMPMKIHRGTGAPLRLIAICPKANRHSFDHIKTL